MEKKTRHRHFWEFQRWINCPNNQKDITNRSRYDFLVEYRCSCGKIEKSEPSLEELDQYAADNSCSTCGEWGSASRHKGERDCITSLRNIRVVLDPPRTHNGVENSDPEDYLDFEIHCTSEFQYNFFYGLVKDRIVMIDKWEDGEEVDKP